jgi:hypothetical protein
MTNLPLFCITNCEQYSPPVRRLDDKFRAEKRKETSFDKMGPVCLCACAWVLCVCKKHKLTLKLTYRLYFYLLLLNSSCYRTDTQYVKTFLTSNLHMDNPNV